MCSEKEDKWTAIEIKHHGDSIKITVARRRKIWRRNRPTKKVTGQESLYRPGEVLRLPKFLTVNL
jgi:hypothetical protein